CAGDAYGKGFDYW
nr:immunoglobulin heavy chain junction region [Macaca mulatta]